MNDYILWGGGALGVLLLLGPYLKTLWKANPNKFNFDEPATPTSTTTDKSESDNYKELTFHLTGEQKELISFYLNTIKKVAPKANHEIWFKHAMQGSSIPEIMKSESVLAVDYKERMRNSVNASLKEPATEDENE